MCRLLGMVSRAQAPLIEHLGDSLKPFAALSSHHGDGWGTALWDENEDLVLTKAPEAADSSPRFWSVAESVVTDAAVLHLRRASPGSPVSMENTHPFVAGSAAFAHNGHFEPVDAVEALVRERGAHRSAGGTDSERYFHLLLSAMRVTDPVTAFQSTAEEITSVTRSALSLNAILMTSQALYALARADPDPRPAEETGGGTFQMFVRRNRDMVVVASDGWQEDYRGWDPVPDGAVVEINRADLSVTMHRPR